MEPYRAMRRNSVLNPGVGGAKGGLAVRGNDELGLVQHPGNTVLGGSFPKAANDKTFYAQVVAARALTSLTGHSSQSWRPSRILGALKELTPFFAKPY
eukprot:6470473-Amphidinium_carterae.1